MTATALPQSAPQHESGLGVVDTFQKLRDAFFRYYDTPFGLADARLQDERRRLLDRDGGVYRRPLIEIRPEYRTTERSLPESVALAKAPAELAEFAAAGLIPPSRALYTHQERALELGMRPGTNVVITAGTGSGKTESFLLPILATLLQESAAWTGTPAAPSPWWAGESGFASQRSGEKGRTQAVRAIILYPMNALVDDQLMRLRKALDSDDVRAWLDANRLGHRFYFGRYTGATPVTGARDDGRVIDDLRGYLREVSRRSARARQLGGDTQYFVPRLDGAEMRSRWDMIDAPPDILITNYSMLNVMLLRERDGRFFDSTAAWLREDRARRFTLVIDELHMYRGTAGTEVAFLIRNLAHRLGLSTSPEQLRVLAASASLDPARDRLYLQEFFGIDQASFEFLPGETIRPAVLRADVAAAAGPLAETPDAAAALEVAEEAGAPAALASAFFLDDAGQAAPSPQAKSERQLQDALFPGCPPETSAAALRQLLAAAGLTEGREAWPRLRAHLFFRNVTGMWACTDPACPAVPEDARPDRTIGKLFVEPATRCDCGARVLELLYCQNCGDVALGGFTAEGITQRQPPAAVNAMLLADVPDLARLPDEVRIDRKAANYLMYWPRRTKPEVDDLTWTEDGGKVQYAFRRSALNPASGELRNTPDHDGAHTGWSFHAIAARAAKTGDWERDPFTVDPFPTICPNCGDDWEIKYGKGGKLLPHTDPSRQRSPIRTMRTGFEKINQILVTELGTQLPAAQRKLIVFTDSRQDAAKLSAGMGLRHYQDLLRILLYEHATGPDPAGDVGLARARVLGEKTAANLGALKRLRVRDLPVTTRLEDLWRGDEVEDPPGETAVLEAKMSDRPSVADISGQLGEQLLRMGINPGGPRASLAETVWEKGLPTRSWSAAYDWASQAPTVRAGLTEPQKQLLREADEKLREEVLQGLFSGAGRDFESLGLGWLSLAADSHPLDVPPNSGVALGRSSLRVLADIRRFQGLREGRQKAHPKLRTFWAAAAGEHGLDPQEVQDLVLAYWGDAVLDYLILPAQVSLRAAGTASWVCAVCRRQHLHRGAGLCTRCRRALPGEAGPVQGDEDFYTWKAVTQRGNFRLNCAELTGQTDRTDAQARQARFQNVFLDTSGEESPRADAVDLLSVTTTMEAGVDIGALEAVVLGNMPPTRFNYQQRVGRAGRRSSPVAVALTVCRGRSHDEYYFERPHLITNEPTPKPYLALERPEIFQRALRSEVLRMAFADLGAALVSSKTITELTSNVHGHFGRVADWPAARPFVEKWVEVNQGRITAAANALLSHAPAALRGADWAKWCRAELVPAVTAAAAEHTGHPDLSQRLAEHGTLPMFGFPTRVRLLHLRRPGRPYPWPPRWSIDRDLAMAVSAFAPMSEVVRDGTVYPAVGITAFKPSRPKPTPEADPLGPERHVAVCRACSYLAERDSAASGPEPCPRCSAPPGQFQQVPVREPLGFRAARGKDFDGNFSWTARAMSAKALTNLDELQATSVGDIQAFSGPGRRYVINDNAGRLYEFQRAAPTAADWGGYVSVEAIRRQVLSPNDGVGDKVFFALGAVQPTDFLFLGARRSEFTDQGLRLNLLAQARQPGGAIDSPEGRRAAWYSLAFLMRTVSASYLDVQELELSAGIYSGQVDGQTSTMAFLADTLENGAGFSTHLGSPDIFPKLVERAEGYLAELGGPDHADACKGSCYRCLRDYSNMAYHALLDWRLAGDLLAVMRSGALDVRPEQEHMVLGTWAEAYGARMLEGAPAATAVLEDHLLYGTCAVIAKHPLESAETTLIAPRLALAVAHAEASVPGLERVVLADTFSVDRNPAHVLDLLEAAEGP